LVTGDGEGHPLKCRESRGGLYVRGVMTPSQSLLVKRGATLKVTGVCCLPVGSVVTVLEVYHHPTTPKRAEFSVTLSPECVAYPLRADLLEEV